MIYKFMHEIADVLYILSMHILSTAISYKHWLLNNNAK